MEYNELITRARRMETDIPETEDLMSGMRRTMRHRRRQRWHTVLYALTVLIIGGVALIALPPATSRQGMTLAERVSRSLNSRPNDIPAPLLGYRHSNNHRQILTLI